VLQPIPTITEEKAQAPHALSQTWKDISQTSSAVFDEDFLIDRVYSLSMPVQFVLDDLAIQSIPMNTKKLCGLGLISVCFGKGGLNEFFFELIQSFI
jgi:hypothetical protein